MSQLPNEPIENYGLSHKDRKRTLFSRIGVVGCGKDGSIIATIAASRGMEVVFLEPTEEGISNAYSRIEKKLDARVMNWGLTNSEKKAILSRIRGTVNYSDFVGCDFVIETIRYDDNTGIRSIDRRKEVFKKLEGVLNPEAIIASNVSTIVVTELSNELEHPERCVGVHFLTNVPDSHVLEIVRGLYTSENTFEKVCRFAELINYDFISVSESVGLVSLRMFLIMLNEACSIVMEGISTVADVDKVLTVGFGHRQGVFRTADQLGIEKIVPLMENLFNEYGNIKYKASPLLLRLYRAKHYGIRNAKGFYQYDENGKIIQ
ncbi:3-hydroxyacyl-CoA dehydrogenase family protein [Paludibacter jiangxiensis]|uniref:3-hydroxybutyryl-CoA dehydrogenase n=1 Tax=Paludibacter jiangxiensis TaxID=681398 RepID=A0A161LSS0_9BACT|nr:3-hydroxyacyl-CoA dehydrogenase family protein [Paludibacter jiangxiensis]GAT63860.1 3-hydroxybutyryl-CoA dehydrogenase [Paludibacter jiangxiensis]